MKLLLVSATEKEIKPILDSLRPGLQPGKYLIGKHQLKVLITGVGMVSTAFEMGKHLATQHYDLAINAGIAGSFKKDLAIGQVLHITDDIFADMGAEDGEDFLSIDKLGFGKSAVSPIIPAKTFKRISKLQEAKSISVNRAHGNENTIAKTVKRLKPQLESMEGAAFFYACNHSELPSIQIRAVSNWVERRNRETWDIPLAIKNLNDFLLALFNDLK
ncbi:MAG: futalosine hydrolase [Sphingobacteriaceae bacterium]